MAKNYQPRCEFHQRDTLPIAYGRAMSIDTSGTHRILNAGFAVMAHGISVPISWGSPPILA